MTTLADLRPGDLMFANRVRPLAADLLIMAGQAALGFPGKPRHVGVVTRSGDSDGMGSLPTIVQAMPSGAEEIEIGEEHWTHDYVYVRPNYYGNLHGGQGAYVADAARRYIGTPYSFLDYAAIAGVHLGIKDGPVRRYVTSSRHMICSQLADQAMADAGFHVFDDGRLPQDVTPSALFVGLLALPGTTVIHG